MVKGQPVGHTRFVTDIRGQLQRAGDELREHRAAAEDAAERVRELVVEALKAGMPQKDVVELSGYTRESVRRMARAAGMKSAR